VHSPARPTPRGSSAPHGTETNHSDDRAALRAEAFIRNIHRNAEAPSQTRAVRNNERANPHSYAMKNKILLLVPLLAAPALYAFAAAPSKVAFQPPEGSTAVKTFENVVELTLDNMDMMMNGEPSPMMPEMDMSITMTSTVTVTDEYVKVRDNAPATLRRTFDELGNNVSVSMEIEMMGQSQSNDQDIEAASELEGKTVVFTWDEDEDGYVKSFDPEEDDSELLEDLWEDMDLRALLPKDDVSEGDEWEIDIKGLATILAPGGNLAMVPEEMDAEAMMSGGAGMGGSMSDFISELLDGEATGKFLGMREVDGMKLGAIKITVDVSSSNDMTEKVLEMMEDLDMEGAPPMDFDHIDVEFTLEGEGELLWDMEAGRAHSFELSGPTTMTYDVGISMEMEGMGAMTIEQMMEMSGTLNMSVSFE